MDKKLTDTLKELKKSFGEGIVSYGSEEVGSLEFIPFSIPSMNRITGVGGIPKGRVTEISGMDGCFKTTIALDLVASEQKNGGICAFLDCEYAYSGEYSEKLGVDNEKLLLFHPTSAEEAFSVIEKLVESGEIALIVVDSTTSLSPATELNNEFGASNMGLMARLNGQFFRKITAKLGKSNTALVLLAQLRQDLGGYAPMKIVPGGNSTRFYSTMRFEIGKASIKEGTDVKGVTLKVKCTKNKLNVPYLSTELEAIFAHGIDKEKDTINELILNGTIEKAGAGWMTLSNGTKLQGLDKVKEFLIDNPQYYDELKTSLNG